MKASLQDLIKHENVEPFEGTLLSLDPGETTGWAVFIGSKLFRSGQIKTKTVETGIVELQGLLKKYKPDFLVYEHYRVYQHKAKDHAHSDLHTSQFIGAIKTICLLWGINYHAQMASVAKGFCTDEKLKFWDMYRKGEKHARDAIRHGTYFLVFNWKKIVKEREENAKDNNREFT